MKKFLLSLFCLTAALSAVATDRLYINDFSISPGETKEVEIMLDNSVAYTALQADIYLPDGLTIEQEDGDYIFDLTDRKARNHTISSTLLQSGAVRILIASQTLKEISGNSGALVVFNIIADASFSGQKTIELKNVVATEPDRTEHLLPDVTCNVTQDGYQPPVVSDDRLYINDFNISPGETKEVEIMLDNSVAYTALQADIYLPDGLTIEQEDGDYIFDLTDRKARNHTISSTLLQSGAVRILIASQTLKEISGNSGALVVFNIIADASFSGQKTIELKNVVATEPDRTEHLLPDVTCNVTQDGSLQPCIDGLYYDFSGNTATVVGCKSDLVGGLNIPESVTYGGQSYTVTAIGPEAFKGNDRLTSVTIPEPVQSIGTAAFRDCAQLKTVYFNAISCSDYVSNSGDFDYDWSPFTDSPIENLYIGNQVTRIPANLANHFELMTSLVIPPSVTSIGLRAFNNCVALKTVELPASITDIGERAFAYALSLETVTAHMEHTLQVTLGSNVFYNKKAGSTLMVPAASIEDYKTADQWKSFNIMPIINQYVTSLTLEADHLAMNVDEKQQLVASVLPENADIKTLNWTSSNPAVATVDQNGNIEGLSQGTTTITVTTTDGSELSASCWVAVFGSGSGKLGDLNGDGIVDVADIAKVIDIVLGK